jgi:hypothetical protein
VEQEEVTVARPWCGKQLKIIFDVTSWIDDVNRILITSSKFLYKLNCFDLVANNFLT